jgi:hypothetical protein
MFLYLLESLGHISENAVWDAVTRRYGQLHGRTSRQRPVHRRQMLATEPPSTRRLVPVMNDAASDAR